MEALPPAEPSSRNGSGCHHGGRVSYYYSAVVWAWDLTRAFAAANLVWGGVVAVVSAVVGSVAAWWRGTRPALTSGLIGALAGPSIVFIVAFVFNLLRFPPTHEANLDTINQRIEALEKRPIAGALDARVPELLSTVSNLEAKVASIDNLIRAQACLDRLNSQAPKDLIDATLENAKKELVTTASPLVRGGNFIVQWNSLLNNISMYVLGGCFPGGESIKFNYEPTEEQLENVAPDEPQTTNVDLLHRYRRFYLQSQFAYQKIEDVRRGLQGRINGLKDQISQSKDSR
jgi:hypothetical protein